MKKLKVVCMGDSITSGFPFHLEDSWVRMLGDATGHQFINKGIAGHTTDDMLYRFKHDVLALQPDYVIIMGGINDVMCRDSLSSICHNFESMVRMAQAQGIEVILGLPTAIDYPAEEKVLARLRQWLLDFAREKRIKVIPFHQAFYDEEGNLRNDLLLADGGHPSMAGYKAMFHVIDPEHLFTPDANED